MESSPSRGHPPVGTGLRVRGPVTRALLVWLMLGATLSGCFPIAVTADPDRYSVRGETALLRATQVALVNRYPEEKKVPVLHIESGGVYSGFEVDLQQVTNAAIKMMGRHLVKNGVAIQQEAPKKIAVSVTTVSAELDAGGTLMRVKLEVQLGDGTGVTVSSDNSSSWSAGRALDGALLFAVTSLLNDLRFVDYVNR